MQEISVITIQISTVINKNGLARFYQTAQYRKMRCVDQSKACCQGQYYIQFRHDVIAEGHYYITHFLRRFIVNESALCYRRMYECMSVRLDVTKCTVTKLQKLQTFTLAQIDLLTIEIDLPSDTEKLGGHLEFLMTNI
jgi:hypothetical protein